MTANMATKMSKAAMMRGTTKRKGELLTGAGGRGEEVLAVGGDE